jgi:hypothetical protein
MQTVCSVSLISLAMLLLFGCANIHFQVMGQPAQQPLCQLPGEQASALVFWGPNWRPDQKEVQRREAFAQRGIEQFFSSSGCFAKVRVICKVGDRESIELLPAEVPGLAVVNGVGQREPVEMKGIVANFAPKKGLYRVF